VKKSSRMICLLAVLVTLLFLAGSIFAQEKSGTIRETITDPNKQPVAGATVTVIDPSHGARRPFPTNGDGVYQATYLLPGMYKITVEAKGFKMAIRENVLLQINGAIQVDIGLEIGGAQETVTVTAELPALNTEDASLGQVVDQQRLNELPVPHGDPYAL